MLADSSVFTALVGIREHEGQLVEVEGFGEIVSRSELERFHCGTNSTLTRHEDGQGVFGDKLAAEKVEAFSIGQVQVKESGIERQVV